jgi:hypothetical protein
VARKILLLLLLFLLPGGLFMVTAALLATGVGKRFPHMSERLRQLTLRGKRAPALPA